MSRSVLVRYGTISEVARFSNAAGVSLSRGSRVVVRTYRGIEVGTLLEDVPAAGFGEADVPDEFPILRASTESDETGARALAAACEVDFAAWRRRIEEWKIQLELIDLEWTLDKSKLILYVLNDRGAECTKLALQAAAAGLGTVEVQPVGPEGLAPRERESSCGSGHCGSGGEGGCCH